MKNTMKGIVHFGSHTNLEFLTVAAIIQQLEGTTSEKIPQYIESLQLLANSTFEIKFAYMISRFLEKASCILHSSRSQSKQTSYFFSSGLEHYEATSLFYDT